MARYNVTAEIARLAELGITCDEVEAHVLEFSDGFWAYGRNEQRKVLDLLAAAETRTSGGPLATPRQVDYILTLLAKRTSDGEGGGFFTGPTDRAGIAKLTKAKASTYITSLKGEY